MPDLKAFTESPLVTVLSNYMLSIQKVDMRDILKIYKVFKNTFMDFHGTQGNL